jgi:predicted DNA-binding transcriptional regulator AlpA
LAQALVLLPLAPGARLGLRRDRKAVCKEFQMTSLLTLEQVAQMLGVSRAWVRDHATRRNPRIPVVRLGGKRAILRFRAEDLENFINAHLSVQEGGV